LAGDWGRSYRRQILKLGGPGCTAPDTRPDGTEVPLQSRTRPSRPGFSWRPGGQTSGEASGVVSVKTGPKTGPEGVGWGVGSGVGEGSMVGVGSGVGVGGGGGVAKSEASSAVVRS